MPVTQCSFAMATMTVGRFVMQRPLHKATVSLCDLAGTGKREAFSQTEAECLELQSEIHVATVLLEAHQAEHGC